MNRSILTIALLCLATAVDGATTITLTNGRSARLRTSNPSNPSVVAKFSRDPALANLVPGCPVSSSVQISAQVQGTTEVRGTGLLSLPCELWQPVTDRRFLYRDREATVGGVDRILYAPGKLNLRIRGGNVAELSGPLDWLEVRLTVGDQSYCGRFTQFRRNSLSQVVASGPTEACAPLCGNGVVDPDEECDDGNAQDGDCCSGSCTYEAANTPCHGNACVANAQCDGAGTCNPTAMLDCDDANHCTIDSCDDAQGCRHEVTPGATCEGDGNYCTSDACDANGTCVHIQRSIACDDGRECTVDDACVDGACVGTYLAPWFNEIDYDDSSNATDDRDEFVEILGPEGFDLSGYSIVSVEGNNTCLTGSNTTNGDAHFVAPIPDGTVLDDDTGSGVGIYVACFRQPGGTSTSSDVGANCTATLDAVAADSNLQNGDFLNSSSADCPDGLLLLDPAGNVVDAVSWEGIVPDTGGLTYGARFHDPAVSPAYSIGRDEGGTAVQDVAGVSIAKLTNGISRAQGPSDWLETGGCVEQNASELLLGTCLANTATPGSFNVGQSGSLTQCVTIEPGCGSGIVDPGEDCEVDDQCEAGWECSRDCTCEPQNPCGDGVVGPGEECDAGVLNSDEPNAACRTDCHLPRCGDGVVDDFAGEACEDSAVCGELACETCRCVLGSLPLSVAAGPTEWCPADDSPGTWARTHGTPGGGFGIPADTCNATANHWTDIPAVTKGPVRLFAEAPGEDGVARLSIAEPQVIGAHMNPSACAISNAACAFDPSQCACRLCIRVEADPIRAEEGFVDCDGGSNVDVRIEVDSQAANPPGSGDPVQPVIGGGPDSGAGAALVYVRVKTIPTADRVTICPGVNDSEWDSVVSTDLVLTTGVAESTIHNPRRCAGFSSLTCPTANPYQVSMQGSPLDCASWSENNGAEFVLPSAILDQSFGPAGSGDIAQVTRITD